MSTNKNKTRQPAPASEPEQDETLDLSFLVNRFANHTGSFDSFKMLQDLFNDHVASGAMEAYTKKALQHFMYHFTLISEVIFELESLAAQKVIDKEKAKAFIVASMDRLAS